MAEAGLFGITKSVLQQLGSPAVDEFRLLWNHKAELEKLEDTVTTIRNVLQDAECKQANNVVVRGWFAQLRVVMYEANDLFEKISTKALQEKEKGKTGNDIRKAVCLLLSKPYHFSFVAKTAHKVKAIRERLDGIARDIKDFNFLVNQNETTDPPYRIQRDQTHSYVPNNEVVGRDQERDDIVKLLLPDYFKEQRSVSVVAVIGIGGLGKTTLAQSVYNDERVQNSFDICIWACITYFTNLKQVLIELMRSVATQSEVKGYDLDMLQFMFRKEIEGKSFLLVLDDVWDEDPRSWHKLKILLDFGKAGSMVLATTRSANVAQSLSATEPYYHLKVMSDESAWLLFKKIAFDQEKKEEEDSCLELEELGQEIVKRCANVPLVIVTLASLVRHKEKSKWHCLVQDKLHDVVPDDYMKIIEVLKISYDELPYQMKSCFAYCSLFPKGYEFEKTRLVRLWISQGFVERHEGTQSIEDRADEYFFYLVDRCFFHNMNTKIVRGVIVYTCQMHELMHDLAMEVAGSNTILVDEDDQYSWNKTLHHVSLNCKSESLMDQVCCSSRSKNLRTFLCGSGISLKNNTMNKLMSGFRSLRVLDLSCLGIEQIPASIGELIHLRFLDLSRNEFRILPNVICTLYHLQYLILDSCVNLKELPKDLGKLLSLRCLGIKGHNALSQMPPGLAALTSLVSLDKLIVHDISGGLRYLECLDNLCGSLKIELPVSGWPNAVTDAEKSCLSRKNRLNGLVIKRKSRDRTMGEEFPEADTVMNALEPHFNLQFLEICEFGGKKMPRWVRSLNNLVILKVEQCGRCVELPPLSHLRSLKELSIQCMSLMLTIEGGMSYNPGDLFFPSLETLTLQDMPNLTSWWLQAPTVLPTFRRVIVVDIGNCPKLTACMPLFPLVEDLALYNVREEVMWQGIGTSSDGNNSELKKLRICEIGGLTRMAQAQIRHLSALLVLSIQSCQQLESVSCSGFACLTSLENLRICGCWNLKWVDAQRPEFDPWGHLLRLERLKVSILNRNLFRGLKYLTCLERLDIQCVDYNNNDNKEDEMTWKSLRKLDSMDLGFGGQALSMTSSQQFLKGVEYLASLRHLDIHDCKELHMSWNALLSLKNLEFLQIEKVERVIEVDLVMDTQIQLRELVIKRTQAGWLSDIPWRSFPALQYLTFDSIRMFEALPEGTQHLSSLRKLYIIHCPMILSLPQWMTSLSSLNTLFISRISQQLNKRCKRFTGEDWPHIQHIANIYIHR